LLDKALQDAKHVTRVNTALDPLLGLEVYMMAEHMQRMLKELVAKLCALPAIPALLD
jgi:hypothetical protein